jgi:hypothetical protein
VAEKGAKGSIFEGNMLPQKMYPQKWRQYLRHNRNPVNPGKWITTDESQVAGWYHSVMTIGPEPNQFELELLFILSVFTHGPLSTYKLFARTYGGKGDEDINRHHVSILLLNSRWYHCMLSCLILSSIMGTVW